MDFGKMGELKKMYDKYRELQKALKNLVIRAKEGEYTNEEGEKQAAVLVDMTGEMKLKDFKINDVALLDPAKKDQLEELIVKAFQKAQTKAQEIAAEKTKDILGFDPSNLAGLLGGGNGAGMPEIPGLS
ncbi:YbaB/EbfC family nucleoid-associated protein [Candidatus Gracilibacteria bacterium]|nr:YbaB/EbfC family nucleoid-associated protein [Candidatus Gracilibacteria bacterium]